jgi:predicted DNA-binding protein
MADMSHLRPDPSSRDIRVSVRVAPQLAARIDTLAAHCGQGRSQFIRTSIAFADAAMALAELRTYPGRVM